MMLDRLEAIVNRFREIQDELADPSVTGDQKRFRMLMKEQNDLSDIVEAYGKYKAAKAGINEAIEILDKENDEDMRELGVQKLCRIP